MYNANVPGTPILLHFFFMVKFIETVYRGTFVPSRLRRIKLHKCTNESLITGTQHTAQDMHNYFSFLVLHYYSAALKYTPQHHSIIAFKFDLKIISWHD